MKVLLLRLEEPTGNVANHQMFSTAQKADEFIKDHPAGSGQTWRIIERDAVDAAVANLVARGR